MKSFLAALAIAAIAPLANASDKMSVQVPGGIDAQGRKVLTFIAKDPPGQRCNGNLQVVADVLEIEGVPKQAKTGLLFNERVRKDFDSLKSTIKSGGK